MELTKKENLTFFKLKLEYEPVIEISRIINHLKNGILQEITNLTENQGAGHE